MNVKFRYDFDREFNLIKLFEFPKFGFKWIKEPNGLPAYGFLDLIGYKHIQIG